MKIFEFGNSPNNLLWIVYTFYCPFIGCIEGQTEYFIKYLFNDNKYDRVFISQVYIVDVRNTSKSSINCGKSTTCGIRTFTKNGFIGELCCFQQPLRLEMLYKWIIFRLKTKKKNVRSCSRFPSLFCSSPILGKSQKPAGVSTELRTV